jgi:class 3 adenylate cyclase
MWTLTITSPKSKPLQIKLTSGKMTIGRLLTCDIVINDSAASRRHAEIYFDSLTESLSITDMKSSNGTYVNTHRISGFYRLRDGDVIRIGQTEMHVVRIAGPETGQKDITGTSLLTRAVVLDAVDENPIPLNEITELLNTVVDYKSVVQLVGDVVRKNLGVDVYEILPAAEFKKVDTENQQDLQARSIRNSSVEVENQALCVPVMAAGKPYALMVLKRKRAGADPFDRSEIQLAIGIGHQIALALQRIELLDKIRREGQVKQLLMRFVSPVESEDLLKEFFATGELPRLAEKKVTVMYAGIAESFAISGHAGEEKLSAYLNTFYLIATQAVFKHAGMIRFLGDGVFAFFTDFRNDEELGQEERAVAVAQEINDLLKNVAPLRPGGVSEAGIAINCGEAFAGYVGTHDRTEFNVLGDLVRVTLRMQEQALPDRLLVGEAMAEAVRNKYLLQKVDSFNLPGLEQPVQPYQLTSGKTLPFVESEQEMEMSAAFRAVAEKLKARKK